MARTVLAAVRPTMAGAAFGLTAPTLEGDAIRPGTALVINNAGTAAVTVTFVTGGTASNLAVADVAVTVAAGTQRIFGPFNDSIFPQLSGTTRGQVHVDYSAVAGVTRAAIALGY